MRILSSIFLSSDKAFENESMFFCFYLHSMGDSQSTQSLKFFDISINLFQQGGNVYGRGYCNTTVLVSSSDELGNSWRYSRCQFEIVDEMVLSGNDSESFSEDCRRNKKDEPTSKRNRDADYCVERAGNLSSRPFTADKWNIFVNCLCRNSLLAGWLVRDCRGLLWLLCR